MKMMNTNSAAGQFGDTTYTKVFVGGLAWETQKDTMKNYFQQFGDILEAVVITDKATGRSKGYGFVTFREAEAAMRACVDGTPVIDGRRANCNLASLGQRSKPSTPNGGRRVISSQSQSGLSLGNNGFASPFPHYAIHQGIPYNLNLYAHGYSSYSPDYTYPTPTPTPTPTSYYGVYGGAATTTTQFPSVYGGAFYPYLQFGETTTNGGHTYTGLHYSHHLYHYSHPINSASAPGYHYASPMSITPPGVTVSIPHR